MDVLLAPTLGEGFGITVIDAQACGVPVIVSDFSAQPELVGHGWKVRGQPLWDATQDAWFQTPSVAGIVDALNESYQQRTNKPSKVARGFVVDNYDADKVYSNMWRPFLASLGKD
jgi:glycosyltransferase involved in cell wall biosynthesis